MMKKCKYCGIDIYDRPDYDGTFVDGYCDKLHRKDHEKQLIKEGKMPGLIRSTGFSVLVDSKMKDSRGETVWFPKNGGYFDRALQRRFDTKKEKIAYMNKNKLAMGGMDDKPTRDVAAGDYRKGKPVYSTPK